MHITIYTLMKRLVLLALCSMLAVPLIGQRPSSPSEGRVEDVVTKCYILPAKTQVQTAASEALPPPTFTSYFTGDTADVQSNPTGGVCLMGGAGEHDDAMTWWLQRADGGDVVVIRASGSDGYNNYLYSQLGVNVNSVETIVFDNDSAAYDPYVIQQLAGAEAIWMAGGDQWNYVRAWRDSPVDSVINLRLAAGAPIGGISAGMAVLGGIYFSAENGTITSAAALANPYDANATVDSTDFFHAAYLDNTITDTHFDDPPREGRLTAFMAKAYQDYTTDVRGIACDEYAAVCIAPDGKAYCYGDAPNYDDFVYFVQPNCELSDGTPEACQAGSPLTWDRNGAALKVYVVNADASGTQFMDLSDWKTASGGSWEEWHASNGVWNKQAANPINCTATAVTDASRLHMDVFPNPASDIVRVRLGESIAIDACLVNELGQEIRRVSGDAGTCEMDLSDLPEGFYLLRVRSVEGFATTRKLVLAR